MALMLIDVDDFKTTNDTFGHDNGDRLLQEFARRLKLCFRIEDTIARIGGDEFAVVLPDSPHIEGLERIARRMRVEMAGGFDADGETVEMSASLGIALYPDHAANGPNCSGRPISRCTAPRRPGAACTASTATPWANNWRCVTGR
jgi:diguanylate cyclase (GGDEF)-like protein